MNETTAVKVLALGASAGGVEALTKLVAGLPADLGAAVLVTMHVPATSPSALPQILQRAGPLPAAHARHGALLEPNTISVAPPGRHLLVSDGRLWLSSAPKVNRHRPALDVMFASAAKWFGPAAVAAVLSGSLDDGAVGAALVARAGGTVVVQDPADAQYASMPRAALAAVPTATVATIADLAAVLTKALERDTTVSPQRVEIEEGKTMSMAHSDDLQYLSADESRLTRLACPDCNGSIAQVDLPTVSYYRCHVGHQWSPQSLAAAQADAAEAALWAAISTLEEHAALQRHLANRAAAQDETAAAHAQAAEHATELAQTIKSQLKAISPGSPGEVRRGQPPS